MAAGLSIKKKNFELFKEAFLKKQTNYLTKNCLSPRYLLMAGSSQNG